MTRRGAPLLLGLCALLQLQAASACSCRRQTDAGFIHGALERLPANARGALFQPPGENPPRLTPAAFLIKSDRHASRLAAELTWLNGPARLLRVAPADGFQPGVRYTITYRGKTESWTYPASTTFVIDHQPLTIGAYQITLTRAPAGTMLNVPDGVICSVAEPAIVAEFRYQLPAHYAPYRSAMMYASQSRTGPGAFAALAHATSYCKPPKLGATALADGRDMVPASCRLVPQRVEVRGRAGVLEVEDTLQPTNVLTLDFGQAADRGCDLYELFRAAQASGDAQRITDAVCALPHGAYPGGGTTTSRPPTVQTLVALTRSVRPPPRDCLVSAAARIIGTQGKFQLSEREKQAAWQLIESIKP